MRAIVRHLGALLVIMLFYAPFGLASGEVFHAKLHDSLTPISSDYLVRVIEQANREGASLIVISLGDAGGLAESATKVIDEVLDSDVPVVVYLPESSLWEPSLNSMIALSADIAVMNRGIEIERETGLDDSPVAVPVENEPPVGAQTSESSATAVQSPGAELLNQQSPSRFELEQQDFYATWATEIAERRGRDPQGVEQAVRATAPVSWEEALSFSVIDLAAQNYEDLMAQLRYHNVSSESDIELAIAPNRDASMTFRENALSFISNPNLVYVLLLVGIFALAFEFMAGGTGIGLVGGGAALVIALMGMQVLPVNAIAIALILVGAILMLVDVYFSATNGLLTGCGIVALLIGSFTLFDFQGIGNSAVGLAWYNIVITVAVLSGLFIYFVIQGIFVSTRQPAMGISAMIGLTGKAKDEIALDGEGMVFVHGEYWRAVPVEEDIESGDDVEVVAIENGRLFIRKHLEPTHSGKSV